MAGFCVKRFESDTVQYEVKSLLPARCSGVGRLCSRLCHAQRARRAGSVLHAGLRVAARAHGLHGMSRLDAGAPRELTRSMAHKAGDRLGWTGNGVR